MKNILLTGLGLALGQFWYQQQVGAERYPKFWCSRFLQLNWLLRYEKQPVGRPRVTWGQICFDHGIALGMLPQKLVHRFSVAQAVAELGIIAPLFYQVWPLCSVARLKNSKTTRNFSKTTSSATRQKIAQNDQFSDQDLSTTSKTTRKYWHATRNFCSREKIEKYFWLILLKTGHFAPIFAKILSEAENAQDCMPGRLRPGQNFADQATLKTPRIVANGQVWPHWTELKTCLKTPRCP